MRQLYKIFCQFFCLLNSKGFSKLAFINRHTLTLLFLFAFTAVISQKTFTEEFEKTSFVVEGKTLGGYKTMFDFSREQVRKGWWKYAREFGSPLDMRKYYKVIIPAASNEGNVDLMIYAVSTEIGDNCSFFLGIENAQYDKQAAKLVKDFKKQFYINFYLAEIKKKQAESEELSEEYDGKRGRRKKKLILDALNEKRAEIDQLKEVIKSIERQ
jgi:hypothetical protein